MYIFIVFLNLFIIFILIILNAFFVASEYAFSKVRLEKLEALASDGDKKAIAAFDIAQKPKGYIVACQLGTTVSTIALGYLGISFISNIINNIASFIVLTNNTTMIISLILAVIFVTLLHITIGEVIPRFLSEQKSEKVLLFSAQFLTNFYNLIAPVISFVNSISEKIIHKMKIEKKPLTETAYSDEELRILVEKSHQRGLINKTEMLLMDNVFDFSDRTATEIMIPRTEISCLYTSKPFEKNLEIALEEQYTRYPLCETDKDNIIGFVHIKDILQILAENKNKDISTITRPLNTFPETILVTELLQKMQKEKIQIVLLIDEYGGTAGIVTLEDIVEEIFGEIRDEFDEEREPIEKSISGYSVDGLVLVEEINDLLDINLDTEVADTIGGWLHYQLGVNPKTEQTFSISGYTFTVDEIVNLRITRISISSLPSQSNVDEDINEEDSENVE